MPTSVCIILTVIAAGFFFTVVRPWYRRVSHEMEREEDHQLLQSVKSQLPPGYVRYLEENGTNFEVFSKREIESRE